MANPGKETLKIEKPYLNVIYVVRYLNRNYIKEALHIKHEE